MLLKKAIHYTRLSVLSVFLIISCNASVLAASVIADTPCDSLYYESLSARAWLEAQREITQNQNLILKPDSVFEYTCFDGHLRELADHAAQMLSETSQYGQPLDTNSMDQALQNLVGTSLAAYVSNNFAPHSLLAGHPAATGIDHTIQAIPGGNPAYSCDIMSRVWQAAKCINFVSNSEFDGFFTFEEYADPLSVDKRHLPTACTSITANWNTNIATALTTGPWSNDPVDTYFLLSEPQNCGGGTCPCTGDPIPTGVFVIRSGYQNNEYQEHVCLQPGCRYYPGGGDDLAPGVAGPGGAGCYGR